MSRRLTDNLSSRYVEAANRLKPQGAKTRVVVYVESYDDIAFWRSALDEFESDKVTFQIMLPGRYSLGKGKKMAMMNHLGKSLGECMIACVDADYDYLMQKHSPSSKSMLDNPFVFHTYVYAIENYQCYAQGLKEACVLAVLNDKEMFSLEAFVREFSTIVWPLFVWNIWCYRHEKYEEFCMSEFCQTISFRDINPYHPEDTLEFVRRQVNKRVARLQSHFPQAKKSYAPLRDELLSLGLTPETAYLYIQGHCLFDGVVMPLLVPLCTLLRKERESEIRHFACHNVQRQNELASYQHSQSPIELMLKRSLRYKESAPYQRLRADLKEFVEGL